MAGVVVSSRRIVFTSDESMTKIDDNYTTWTKEIKALRRPARVNEQAPQLRVTALDSGWLAVDASFEKFSTARQRWRQQRA